MLAIHKVYLTTWSLYFYSSHSYNSIGCQIDCGQASRILSSIRSCRCRLRSHDTNCSELGRAEMSWARHLDLIERQSSNLDDAYYRSFTEFLNPSTFFLLRDNKYHTVLMFEFVIVIQLH